MSDATIDARGLSCPQPVVLTQKAIKEGKDNFKVLVNSEVSKENVMRCAAKNKMKSVFSLNGDDIIITISK